MASGYFSSKENEKAIAAFDSVLMVDPDHLNSIFNKAQIYMALGNTTQFGESIDLFIEKVGASGDSARLEQAKGIATDYFRVEASKANQAEDLDSAVVLLDQAIKYGPDKNIYYLMANVYNKQENFSGAAENAQMGLDLETGTDEDKARFYYELAVAQVGMGQTSAACENFQRASYGDFAEASQAQRTNLKCP
jgi:tetratricopeptide (TPR) repeat protein